MTKKNSTKRTLLMSGLALLVCISMLIGSTFAWFTDNVTSASNIIKSGTLDVEMYWADGKEAPDTASWNDASTGAIFNYDLWEPGFVQVRHIKIENVGNLALKYQLSIAANGQVTDLADVIDVYYVDPATQVSDRTALAANMKLGTLTEVLADFNSTASGKLEAGKNHTVTIALKMREEAGNEYQNKGIGADFSVILTATQVEFESDSFGTDYDASATLPEVGTATVDGNSGATTIDAGNVSVTIPEGVPEGDYEVVVTNKNATTNTEGQTTFTADINLLKDGVKVERNGATVYIVEIKLETEKVIVKVLHNGNEISDYDYDAATGILTFETDSFSSFAVVYEENKEIKVNSVEALKELVANVTEPIEINATGLVTTIGEIGKPDGSYTVLDVYAGTKIKGLTLTFGSNQPIKTNAGNLGSGEIVFENCTFISEGFVDSVYFQSGTDASETKLVFINCTFAAAKTIVANNTGAGVEYNNCKFTLNSSGYGLVQCMGGNHTFNTCEFSISGSKSIGSSPITKYGQLNLYSERYSTVVTANKCVNVPSVFRYAASTGTNTFTNNQ